MSRFDTPLRFTILTSACLLWQSPLLALEGTHQTATLFEFNELHTLTTSERVLEFTNLNSEQIALGGSFESFWDFSEEVSRTNSEATVFEPRKSLVADTSKSDVASDISLTSFSALHQVRQNEILQRFQSSSQIDLSSSVGSYLISQSKTDNVNPNDERFLQSVPDGSPLPSTDQSPRLDFDIAEPVTPNETPEDSISFFVNRITVKGSTVFSDSEFRETAQKLEGKNVSLKELQDYADSITRKYIAAGFITSKAVLVDQTVDNGVVQIQIIEGVLSDIEVQGNKRLNKSYIRSRLRRGLKQPLEASKLEENLRLLSLDSLFKDVKGRLKPGEQLGESILVVEVERARAWDLTVGLDNYSVPSIAPERVGASFSYNNLTGLGDTIAASYYRGLNFGDFDLANLNQYFVSYSVPVNAMDGTLQLSVDVSDRKVTDPIAIEGETEQYQVSFRQPVIRKLREEFALSLGFVFQNGRSLIAPPFDDTLDRNRVLSVGQDYLRRDSKGFWAARSQFNIGLDVFDARPAETFLSWSGQAQRVHNLGNDFLLIMQGELQFTPDDLPSFYEFVIGGGQSIRGYRQNLRSGDSGYRFSLESRLPVLRRKNGTPTLQFVPFFDVGQIWDKNDAAIEQDLLAGIGIGLIWEPIPEFNLRLDYGYPIIDTDSGARSLQDEAIHFSLSYRP